MRAYINTTETRSNLVRRLLIVCLALAAISTSSFSTVTRAEDIPDGGTMPVTISYFGAMLVGDDLWVADGVVGSQDLSGVSIEFSGAANASTKPDPYGYFSLILSAPPGSILEVEATDAMGTANDQIVLNPFMY